MRNLGDKVWVARFDPICPDHVTCPDCGGTGRVRVIFHDDTIASTTCGECSRGYEPPTGTVLIYRNAVRVEYAQIKEIRQSVEEVEYIVDGKNYVHTTKNVFDCQEDAQKYGEAQQAEYQQKQIEKINRKEKGTRSWAWNASYHRRQIKQLQKDLDYHTSKLSIASLKAKDEQP